MFYIHLIYSFVINNYVFWSRTPSKSKVTPNSELSGLGAKGNHDKQTPSKMKGSSQKPLKGDVESDSDNIPSKSNSKASGKQTIKSQVDSNSDNEALMSPFEHVDPRHSNKGTR